MKSLRSIFLSVFLIFFSIAGLAAESVDVNTADAPTIAAALKGVGPKTAQAIVAYRDKNGAFKSMDELAKVKGIGQKTILKNRDKIKLSVTR